MIDLYTDIVEKIKIYKYSLSCISVVANGAFSCGVIGVVIKAPFVQPLGPRHDFRFFRDLNIYVTFFSIKIDIAFHPSEVGK